MTMVMHCSTFIIIIIMTRKIINNKPTTFRSEFILLRNSNICHFAPIYRKSTFNSLQPFIVFYNYFITCSIHRFLFKFIERILYSTLLYSTFVLSMLTSIVSISPLSSTNYLQTVTHYI